jgi:two-component sensor histidine kinase/PAS domain-containing protein
LSAEGTGMVSNIFYLVSIIIAGSITTAMAMHLWMNRKILELDFSIILLVGLWIWIAAQIGECIFTPLTVKIVFYKIKFPGISIVSVTWLGFCYQYVTGKKKLNVRIFIALFTPLFCFNMLSFFSFIEVFFWKQIFISPNNLLLEIVPNLGYFIFIAYCLTLIILGLIIILISFLRKKNLIKKRMVPLLFAALISIAAGAADFLFRPEFSYYRFFPIVLSLSSLIVIYYLRLRYFRIIPLAQHTVIESMSDGLIIVDPDNTVIYMNPNAYSLFNESPITLIGKQLDLYQGDLKKVIERIENEKRHNDISVLKERIYDVRLSMIKNRGGKIVNKIIILRDVTQLKDTEDSLREMKEKLEVKVAERTKELENINETLKKEIVERKKAEEKIQTSLEEKSILFGELHHRVKNNLQIVSSLLKLQSYYIIDKEARELFEVSVSRIRSIAMVHEKLYKSGDIAHTQFSKYIQELVQSVIFSHSKTSEQILLNLDIEPIHLDIDKSILAGLIVNELVMNSLKHAFPLDDNARDEKKKEIGVEFKIDNGDFILVVSDNGRGMPANFNINEAGTLGMKIIMTLVKQLKGTVEYLPFSGNKIRIRFPAASTELTSS